MSPQLILALDVGTVRVGTALSSGILAQPHQTFERAQGVAEKEILSLIAERQIEILVVGLPLGDNGERTRQCDDVERFVRRLTRRAKVSIVFVDEYASSATAAERLRESGRGRKSVASGTLDAGAAAVILQDYLDRQRDQ